MAEALSVSSDPALSVYEHVSDVLLCDKQSEVIDRVWVNERILNRLMEDFSSTPLPTDFSSWFLGVLVTGSKLMPLNRMLVKYLDGRYEIRVLELED